MKTYTTPFALMLSDVPFDVNKTYPEDICFDILGNDDIDWHFEYTEECARACANEYYLCGKFVVLLQFDDAYDVYRVVKSAFRKKIADEQKAEKPISDVKRKPKKRTKRAWQVRTFDGKVENKRYFSKENTARKYANEQYLRGVSVELSQYLSGKDVYILISKAKRNKVAFAH